MNMTRMMTTTVLAALLATGCGGGTEKGPAGAPAASTSGLVTITGAGATFPYPVYSKWFDEYHKRHQTIQINYQSIGSGGGIRQLLAGTVDFGASDGPMTDEQLAQAKTPVLHFPTVVGAVVPTYNLPGLAAEVKFTGEALAGIYLGTITKWNDPALASVNPGVALPNADIVVVHRSDGSGTSYIWTDYLSKVSPAWQKTVGRNTAVSWPVGLGGKGNEGVAGLVQQTPNSIGYVELVYAVQNKMQYGAVRNAAGAFMRADLASVSAAAASATMPADFRVSITNAPGAGAYPVASFTWLLIPTTIDDSNKGHALVAFLKWMLADGQPIAQTLSYAPLPPSVVSLEEQAIAKVQVGQ